MTESNDRSFTDSKSQPEGGDNQPEGGQGPSFDTSSQTQSDQNRDTGNQDGLQQQVSVLEKRLNDKDSFIDQLKGENRQKEEEIGSLKSQVEDLNKRAQSVEEVLERIRASEGGQGDDGNRLTPEEAKQLAENAAKDVYHQQQSEKEKQSNLQSVQKELLQVYGNDKVDNKVSEIASNLEMTFDEAFEMAQTRPAAFRRLFIGEKTNKEPSAPGSSVNPEAFQNTQNQGDKDRRNLMEMRNDRERVSAIQERMKQYST